MSGVQIIDILPQSDALRLDRFLRHLFPSITQGYIEKLCRKGSLRLDGRRVKASTRLAMGQKLRLPPISITRKTKNSQKYAKPMSAADLYMIRKCILYRDAAIIVLNKPPGVPVQGGSKSPRHIDGLSQALCFDYDIKPKLVHRLDKHTSGILLMARNRQVAAYLTTAFRRRRVQKIYWAAVKGRPYPPQATLNYSLVKRQNILSKTNIKNADTKMFCLDPESLLDYPTAKAARTHYYTVASRVKHVSWLALSPMTGRKHQIRAHLAHHGFGIIGDRKYTTAGGDPTDHHLDGNVLSRKLHLHARSIKFIHPLSKKSMYFNAPLPLHMQKTWNIFNWQIKKCPSNPFMKSL